MSSSSNPIQELEHAQVLHNSLEVSDILIGNNLFLHLMRALFYFFGNMKN